MLFRQTLRKSDMSGTSSYSLHRLHATVVKESDARPWERSELPEGRVQHLNSQWYSYLVRGSIAHSVHTGREEASVVSRPLESEHLRANYVQVLAKEENSSPTWTTILLTRIAVVNPKRHAFLFSVHCNAIISRLASPVPRERRSLSSRATASNDRTYPTPPIQEEEAE